MLKNAIISPDGVYRYSLLRVWGDEARVTFIMLNPSTADAEIDDPTIRRCVNFAKTWGYGGIEVVNLFAFRATDPVELFPPPVGRTSDPIGPENDHYIEDACAIHPRVGLVVCAWGAHSSHADGRSAEVRELIKKLGRQPHYLGLTQKGEPRHPLYLRADSKPVAWAA